MPSAEGSRLVGAASGLKELSLVIGWASLPWLWAQAAPFGAGRGDGSQWTNRVENDRVK